MTITEALRFGTIDPLDREVIVATVLKKDRVFLLAHPEAKLSKRQEEKIKQLIQERATEKPLAYILGEKEFFGLPFFVNRFTLIPRPETELMVEEALKLLTKKKNNSSKKKIAVIDVGTGSGCIIVSIVRNFPSSVINHQSSISFFAVDTSSRTLQIAKKNAIRHGVQEKITFAQSNLLQTIEKQLKKFDEVILLANLPYLSEEIYQETEPTVRNFEPKSALISGRDGLNHYRRLFQKLPFFSKEKKIYFFLEISPEQARLIPNLLSSFEVQDWEILPDLTDRSRLLVGSR